MTSRTKAAIDEVISINKAVVDEKGNVYPAPAPLPVADREVAPYYVLIRRFSHPSFGKCATVYVKEGEFFRYQKGLTEDWGENWQPVHAASLNDARTKAHASEGTSFPYWQLEEQVET